MAKPARARDQLAAFLGREKELDHLKNALHQAASGKGRVELICGEPGIGKTRLLESLTEYAESFGALVMSAACVDDPGSLPYWPWSQILLSLVSGMDQTLAANTLGSGLILVTEAFPLLKSAFRSPASTRAGLDSAESARFRLFDAVARLLAARSATETLVLLIDDLHWADEPSLKLLVHVCGGIQRSRILLVGAYRELGFEPGHPLPASVGALAQKRFCGRIPLQGLSEADTTELLVKGIGASTAHPLALRVFHLTDGNPLFITQIIRLLADHPGAETAPGGLAASARDIIARRLAGLSAACNEVLTMAAVLGSEFAASALGQTADPRRAHDVSPAIDEAVRERMIDEAGEAPGRYRFCHVLIRDAILSALQPGRRARLHARAFEALENLWGADAPAHAAELLVHAVHGQAVLGPEAAARYAGYAGETALRAHAFEDARRHFAAGLVALQDRPMGDLKAALVLGSAKARAVLDMGHESRVLFQQSFEYYEAKNDTSKMVEVLTWRYVLPEPVLLPLYERTLRQVAPDSRERGYLLASYAIIKAFFPHAGAEGTAEFREALRLARLHKDEWLEMRVLWLSVLASGWQVESSSRERREGLEKADELARSLGDCPDELWIRSMIQEELLSQGRVDEAEDLVGRMAQTAERGGDLIDRMRVRGAELAIAWHRAQWGRVRELASDRLEQTPPLYLSSGYDLALRCEAAYEAGDSASGGQDLLRLVETTRAVPRVPAEIFLTCGFAITNVCRVTGEISLLGDAQAFARLILELPAVNEGKRRDAHYILARVSALLNDAGAAAAEYDYFTDLLRRTPAEDRPFSAVHEVLGSLAAVREELDRAAAHYADAIGAACHTVHERAWIAYEFARVLGLRRSPGDLGRARDLLRQCMQTAQSSTMVPLAQRAQAALAALGANGRLARPDGLTDRETEVLALIARGLTNKEIGAKLFISAKTVDAHVRNILDKTGTANRTEAATYAIRHDVPGV